jgi:hypothetical protein
MSDQCWNAFGWCDETDKEFVDFDELSIKLKTPEETHKCLAVTFNLINNESVLLLHDDDCSKHKFVLCEEVKICFIEFFIIILFCLSPERWSRKMWTLPKAVFRQRGELVSSLLHFTLLAIHLVRELQVNT